MADGSSRLLLAPNQYGEKKSAWTGKTSTYKTPVFLLLLLTLLLSCIIAIILVLVLSDGDSVDSWTARPNVLIGLFAGIYVVLLGGLFTIGVAITWWRILMHGTTLKRLYFVADAFNPMEFVSAFMAGGHARRISIVAFTVLVVKLAINPMLQQATTVEQKITDRESTMRINIAPQIPDGFLGTWEKLGPEGIKIAQGTVQNLSIATQNDDGFSCMMNAECTGTVPGAGLNYACTSETQILDFLNADPTTMIFGIDSRMAYDFGQPMLHVTAEYISSMSDKCQATVTTDSCYLLPATVNYPISIQNSTVTMDPYTLLEKLTMERNYSSAADTEPNNDTYPLGPLSGALYGIGPTVRSSATIANTSTNGSTFFPLQNSYFLPGLPTLYLNTSTMSTLPEQCALQWSSPIKDVLAAYFDFQFRSAMAAGTGTSQALTPDFTATVSHPEPRYHTRSGWLIASALLMFLGLAAGMVPVWGFWQLSHHPTLSPLETGKAFGGPILQHAGPEKEGRNIMQEIGHERVAYDGSELIWNGSVYTSGADSPLVRRMDGFYNTDATPLNRKGKERQTEINNSNTLTVGQAFGSGRGRGLGHRRGMSSISEAESEEADITTQDIASPTATQAQTQGQYQAIPQKQLPAQQPRTRSGSFEHSRGVTTRRFDDHFHEHHEANPESRHIHGQNQSSAVVAAQNIPAQATTPPPPRARTNSTVSISPISAGGQSQRSMGQYSAVSAPSTQASYYNTAIAATAAATAPATYQQYPTQTQAQPYFIPLPPQQQHQMLDPNSSQQSLPIILTPGKGGVPSLPPIPPMGNLSMDHGPTSSTGYTPPAAAIGVQGQRQASRHADLRSDSVMGPTSPGGFVITSPPPPLLQSPLMRNNNSGGYGPVGARSYMAHPGTPSTIGGVANAGRTSPAVERAMQRQLSLIDEISRHTPT